MANNVLEFYIKLKDMMSSGLAKIAKAGKEGLRSVANSAKEVQHFINQGANAVGRFASSSNTATSRVVQNNRVVGGSYKALLQEIDKVKRKIQESGDGKIIAFNKNRLRALNIAAANHAGNLNPATTPAPNSSMFSGMLKNALRMYVPIATAAGAMSFISSSAHAGMEFEAQQKTYQVMAGKQRGTQLSGELRDLKQNTIMGSAVYQNAQTMMGFGISDKEVIGNLKMLGDVAMGDADKLGRLTLAFSQTQSAGKLMGQDLLQYINAGFNPLYYLSIKTGKSIGVLREEMEKGAITSAMVTEAFQMATGEGGKFNNMMEQMSETTFGKVKMMEGQWQSFKISVGNALSPVVKLFASLTTGLLKSKPAMVMFGIALLGLVASLSMTALATTKVTAALTALKTAMLTNPATAWIAGISVLIGVLGTLIGKLDGVSNKAQDINDKFNQMKKNAAVDAANDAAGIAGEKIGLASNLINIIKEGSVNSDIREAKLKSLKNSVPVFFDNISSKDNYSGLDDAFSKYKDAVYIHEQAVSAEGKLVELQKQLSQSQQSNVAESYNMKKNNQFGEMVGAYRSVYFKPYTGSQAEAARKDWLENKNKELLEGLGEQIESLKGDIAKDKNSILAIAAVKSGSTTTKEDTDNVSKSVVSGGPRVININGVTLKFADKIDIAAKDPEDLINKAEPEIKSMWLRVLNSGAKMQG